jgi:tRNA dimethylallyltransferase
MAKKDTDSPMMITILGPTATGKTRIAAHVAAACNGEIISADSRQVYRRMDMGTGKDYDDYTINGVQVPYHLIDIAEPGEEYNVFSFRKDFVTAFSDIVSRHKQPVMCGGSGMYLEAVLKNYQLAQVPENPALRQELAGKTIEELVEILKSFKTPHNTTDTTSISRAVRAIEICSFADQNPSEQATDFEINHKIFGISLPRDMIRIRITERLKLRLENGMIGEVEELLESGLHPEKLAFYGLEYRYLTEYVTQKISYKEMFQKLNTAIHQFAKRQMTWFRHMEKLGISIEWLDGTDAADIIAERIVKRSLI